MGDSRTLQQLIDDVAARADVIITASSHTNVTQVATWINQFFGKMRGRVIQEFDEDYFTKTESPIQATVAGTGEYANPADFFKLLGLDFSVDGGVQWHTAKRLNMGDRNNYGAGNSVWSKSSPPRYKLFGVNTMVRPVPDGVYHLRRLYAPTLVRITDLAGTFEFYNGWDRYVCASVAMLVLARRQQDPSAQKVEAAEGWLDICNEVRVRDAAEPARVQDVRGYSGDDFDSDEEEGL